MARRQWNQPVVEETGDLERMPDGRWRPSVQFGLCEEDHGMIREGYKCPWCLEVFDSNDVDRCPICDLTKEQRDDYYQRTFMGPKRYGSQAGSVQDRVDRLDEEAEEWRWARKKGLWLPGDD